MCMTNDIEYVLLDKLAHETDDRENDCKDAAARLWASQAELHKVEHDLNAMGSTQTTADHIGAVANYLRVVDDCSRRANDYLVKLEELSRARLRQASYQDEVDRVEAAKDAAAQSVQERKAEDIHAPLWP